MNIRFCSFSFGKARLTKFVCVCVCVVLLVCHSVPVNNERACIFRCIIN